MEEDDSQMAEMAESRVTGIGICPNIHAVQICFIPHVFVQSLNVTSVLFDILL